MHTVSRRNTAAFAGLVVAGLFVSSGRGDASRWAVWPLRPVAETGPWAERQRLEEAWRQNQTGNEFNCALVDDLADGRVGLGEAVALFLAANPGRGSYLEGVRVGYPAPTREESAARCLVYRVEVGARVPAAVRAAGVARVRAEYVEMFGRPFAPPTGTNSDRTTAAPVQ